MTRDDGESGSGAGDALSPGGQGATSFSREELALSGKALAHHVSNEMVRTLIKIARSGKRESVRVTAALKVLELAGDIEPSQQGGARVVVITQGEASRASELLAEERRRALQEG